MREIFGLGLGRQPGDVQLDEAYRRLVEDFERRAGRIEEPGDGTKRALPNTSAPGGVDRLDRLQDAVALCRGPLPEGWRTGRKFRSSRRA
jgi:hypothetical protein